jgi:hypothetical protein
LASLAQQRYGGAHGVGGAATSQRVVELWRTVEAQRDRRHARVDQGLGRVATERLAGDGRSAGEAVDGCKASCAHDEVFVPFVVTAVLAGTGLLRSLGPRDGRFDGGLRPMVA